MRRLLLTCLFALVAIPAVAQYPVGVSPPVFVIPASAMNGAGVVTCPQGIGTTSTDCVLIANNTPATAGVTVQLSPRVRLSGTAWTGTASKTVSFFTEVLPATAATPTGTWKLGYQLEGAAATYPLTVTSAGVVNATGLFSPIGSTLDIGTQATGVDFIRIYTRGVLNWTINNGEIIDLTGSGIAARKYYFSGTSSAFLRSGLADGLLNITDTAGTAGVGLDVTTDAILKVRTRAQTGDAGISALTATLSGPAATLGAGASSSDLGSVRRLVSKYSVTSLVCVAPFQAAATTADCVIATLPIKTRLVAIYADTLTGWTCSGTCTGTKTIGVGKSAGGVEYLKTGLDVAATGQWGIADADMGSEMTRAAKIQDSALVNWAATIPVTVRFTSGTGNWGSGAATYVNAGATTFYLVTESLP